MSVVSFSVTFLFFYHKEYQEEHQENLALPQKV